VHSAQDAIDSRRRRGNPARALDAEAIMPINSVFAAIDQAKLHLENLSIQNLIEELEDDPDLLLVDIRELQERVDLGAIPGSVHVPRGMLEFWADPQSRYYREYFRQNRRTVLYCAGGGRSVLAARALIDMGFADVAHVEQGFAGWERAGLPVEDVRATSRWIRRDAT
jgi:rhodanese-related sulfurtransferase